MIIFLTVLYLLLKTKIIVVATIVNWLNSILIADQLTVVLITIHYFRRMKQYKIWLILESLNKYPMSSQFNSWICTNASEPKRYLSYSPRLLCLYAISENSWISRLHSCAHFPGMKFYNFYYKIKIWKFTHTVFTLGETLTEVYCDTFP